MNKKYPLHDRAKRICSVIARVGKRFSTSEEYWQKRYKSGGNSGAGSYLKLARFKAEVLNQFIHDNKVNSVIEFGSGDGSQLKLGEYPPYIGFDVSSDAISLCRENFVADASKHFKLVSEYRGEVAELSLSLDVIYHLVEDEVFEQYMSRLFNSSSRYVIIYSSDHDEQERFQPPHVKHRRFSGWIDKNQSGWKLIEHIPNEYSLANVGKANGSSADFFIYERR